ncbi:MAG: anti-sigma F factor [Clostridiales bacterium]|jgi:stage II sporulation protein AB (anti-sigma F factor)|nr:anti-sigma F factor [Clostridiales bacterium]
MKVDNEMILTIPALSKNESFARSAVAAFAVEMDPSLEEINDIKTAVCEAVTNSIVHGYDRQEGYITIKAKIIGKTLHIEVSDNGIGIKDIPKARQPYFTTKPEEERTGMGFTVMETFMDSLEVAPNENGGVKVIMSKTIKG